MEDKQCCVGLCCTTMQISHNNYIYIPSFCASLPPPPTSSAMSLFSGCQRQKHYLPNVTRGLEGGAPSLPLL